MSTCEVDFCMPAHWKAYKKCGIGLAFLDSRGLKWNRNKDRRRAGPGFRGFQQGDRLFTIMTEIGADIQVVEKRQQDLQEI